MKAVPLRLSFFLIAELPCLIGEEEDQINFHTGAKRLKFPLGPDTRRLISSQVARSTMKSTQKLLQNRPEPLARQHYPGPAEKRHA